MASRYSAAQSSSLAGLTRLSTALRRLVAADLASRVEQHFDQRLEVRVGHGAVDQQRFGRPAHAGAPHFGVEHDLLGHVEVGGLVDIDVADAFQVGEHRQPRFRLHARDQALAAARHDDVDIAVEAGQHEADGGAVARLHDVDGGRRQAGFAQALLHGAVDGAAGAQAVGAAAQDGGIARFQAERAGIGGHVGAAFVDDADHAERHPHPLDGHAVRPRPGRHHACRPGPSRSRMTSMPAAMASTRASLRVSRSRKACVAPPARASADVLGIGGQDRRAFCAADGGGHARPARGFSARPGPGPARGRPRARCGRPPPWRRRYRRCPRCF